MKILITGGAGFIGSAVARRAVAEGRDVVVLDHLGYAGNLANLADVAGARNFWFEQSNICDRSAMDRVFQQHQPDAVLHLAAESHVDRSIDGPMAFVETNVSGTATLLEAARCYLEGLQPAKRDAFVFQHISTDEVFGELGTEGLFCEATPYAPSSPYAASKAASDLLVRAWARTFGLPVIVTNCSNNYGPYQFPEKLIPVVIMNALQARPIPIYGQGANVRDWLHVDDHAEALLLALDRGRRNETYCIGGDSERSNLELVLTICRAMDELRPQGAPHNRLIKFVEDRPGHDQRYAIDASKIRRELGWRPRTTLDDGLMATVRWYLEREDWWAPICARGAVGRRLGLTTAAE